MIGLSREIPAQEAHQMTRYCPQCKVVRPFKAFVTSDSGHYLICRTCREHIPAAKTRPPPQSKVVPPFKAFVPSASGHSLTCRTCWEHIPVAKTRPRTFHSDRLGA